MAPGRDGLPSRPMRITGVIMPKRNNTIGLVYIKDGKIYLTDKDDNDDYLIESLDDLKKAFTIKKLKNKPL